MQFYNIQKIGVLCRVGNDLISRRHGVSYYSNEIELFKKGLKIGHINWYNFCFTLVIRGFVRIVPKPVTKWFYNSFLRQKQHG
jgi:hypothetical protein